MIIDCISDLHGFYPHLDGGDLLIIAGDLTAKDTIEQHSDFKKWLYVQKYTKKIVVAGNHDNDFIGLSSHPYIFSSYNTKTGKQISYAEYLCDSVTEFEGLKIWGSPWTKTFPGMNPKCKAFTFNTEDELYDKFVQIPLGLDILITHGPAYGILDGVPIEDGTLHHCGSKALYNWLKYVERPRYHIFGHIHEAYGQEEYFPTYLDNMMQSINCSHVDGKYRPVNKPIRIIL